MCTREAKLKRKNQFSITLSDTAVDVVNRYAALLGISRGALIESWIIEGLDVHLACLNRLEKIEKDREEIAKKGGVRL